MLPIMGRIIQMYPCPVANRDIYIWTGENCIHIYLLTLIQSRNFQIQLFKSYLEFSFLFYRDFEGS